MEFVRLFTLSLSILFAGFLSAQCTATVDVGPDIVVCPGTNSIDLEAIVTGGDPISVRWSPDIGLDDTESLTPRVSIAGNITYTVTVTTSDPDNNLISNGDFEAGNVDFTTDYELATTSGPFGLLSAEGTYAISTNTNLTHSNFANCTDHTGGGQMMVVNGSSTPNEKVWCQTVTVEPATDYRFSAWLMSVVNDPNVADLQFSVNGLRLGDRFRADRAVCDWNEFAEEWNSGGSTSAEICLVNQSTSVGGNDFALDDISFSPVCEVSDEINIEVIELIAQAQAETELLCDETTILDGFGSSEGAGYTYLWTTADGNIISGATTLFPEVNAAGTYVLSVRYDDGVNSCPDAEQATTLVVLPTNPPVATITEEGNLGCSGDITLSADGSTTGDNISYEWETTDGNIISGANTERATINRAGTYFLFVTDEDTGCFAETSVEVIANGDLPEPRIAPPAQLTCGATRIRLNALATTPATDITVRWVASNGGNIFDGGNTLTPQVDQPGTYTLIVTDNVNGCENSASVEVERESGDLVRMVIDVPIDIDCRNPEVTLMVNNILPGITYQWSTRNGNIVSGADTDRPVISAGGTYVVIGTNPGTGCVEVDSVVVGGSLEKPAIRIVPPVAFSCDVFEQRIDATASASGPNYQYFWKEESGNAQIVTGATTLEPVVSGSGTYSFRIFDLNSGCSRDTLIMIADDADQPIADAGEEGYLGCNNETVVLDGSGSSQGDRFGYRWTTLNGNILTPDSLLQITVDAPGTYLLAVFDRDNGCNVVGRVRVFEYEARPEAIAVVTDSVSCLETEIDLDATASVVNIDQLAQWTTTDGLLISGGQTLTPRIGAPGVYQLMLTDTVSGCRDSTLVTVGADTLLPSTFIAPAPALTCLTDTVALMATTGENTSWTWGTDDGDFAGDVLSLTPRVAAAGTYFITVRDTENGCVNSDTVTVNENVTPPTVALGDPNPTLTCRNEVVTLGADAGANNGLRHSWTTSTVAGQVGSTPILTVSDPGTYRLEVENTENGCVATDSIVVVEDRTPPTGSLTDVDDLNCTTVEQTLVANLPAGNDYTLNWLTPDGQITGAADQPQTTVTAAGEYLLALTANGNGCTDTIRTTVGQDTVRPLATLRTPDVLDCRTTSTGLSVQIAGDADGLDYTWSTPDGTLIGSLDQPANVATATGTYNLRVTNRENTCFTDLTTEVIENLNLPEITFGDVGMLDCLTDSLSLVANVTSSGDRPDLRWTSDLGATLGATPNIRIGTAGTYYLAVQDTSNGCFATDSLIVTEDRQLPEGTLAPVADLNCTATERELLATLPDGNNYTINWTTTGGQITGPADQASTTITAAGNYLLGLTDENTGCTDTLRITVGSDTEEPVATITEPTGLDCQRTSADLLTTISGQTDRFTYAWSTTNGNLTAAANSQNNTANGPGTYRLIVTDTINTCSTEAEVTVTEDAQRPVLAADPADLIDCRADTVRLRSIITEAGNNPVINWSTTNGSINGGATSATPLVSQSGTYLLRVTNPDNACTDSLTVNVSENTTEPVITLDAAMNLGCEDVPVNLTATAAGNELSYAWTTTTGNILEGGNTAMPLVQGGGIYELEVTDGQNGCTATARLSAEQRLLTGFDFTAKSPNCTNPLGRISFDRITGGTAPFLYSVDGGATFELDEQANSLAPGNYQLIVQDANGCEQSAETSINELTELTAELDRQIEITFGESYLLDLQVSIPDDEIREIIWTPTETLDCTGCFRPIATPTETTTYQATVITVDDCRTTAVATLVVADEREVYFPTAFSPNGDGANDIFGPMGDAEEVAEIRDFAVYSRWGEKVHEWSNFLPNDPDAAWDGRLDAREMAPGVFIYHATVEFTNGRVETYKGDVMLLR